MANKSNTENISIGPNQPHSQELKDSVTAVPSDFISSQSIRRYAPYIPTQSTLDPSYTSSTVIPDQDSSSNKELRGVSSKKPLYLIPKTKFNQLHCHT